MDHAIDIVVLAVSAFITAILLSSGKLLSDTGTNFVKMYNSKITEMSVSLNGADANSYNGVILSGADVMNAVKRYAPEGVTVNIVTKNIMGYKEDGTPEIAERTTEYNGSYEFPGIDAENYVNPSAEFTGVATVNSTYGYLTQISFTQNEATNVAEPVASREPGNGLGGDGGGGSPGYQGSVSLDMSSLNAAIGEISEALKTVATQLETILTSQVGGGGPSDGQASASANLSTALQNLQTIVQGLKEDTESADADLDARISSLVTSVSNMQSTISSLQTTVNGLRPGSGSGVDLSGIESSLSALQSSLNSLKNSSATKSDISNLQSSVTDTSNPNSLASQLRDLKYTVSSLQTDVSNLKSAVSALQRATGTGG